MTPQQLTATVEYSRHLAGNFLSLALRLDQKVEYEAGQYLSLQVNPEGERRSYSLASWPSQPKLELVVDTTPMGKGSKFILGLKPGDEVPILFPLGRFTIEQTVGTVIDRRLIFIATGSGIVPLRSMIHSLLEDKQYRGPVDLHWGMRFQDDLFWVQEFENLATSFSNFKFDISLSKADDRWHACWGHVNDCLVKHYQTFSGGSAFICGNEVVIADVAKLLAKKGMPPSQIFHEQFF